MGKTSSIVIISLCLIPMFVFGLFSLLDHDPVRSDVENRMLETKPELSVRSFFSGEYMKNLSAYYADTFPMREMLMKANKGINGFYFYQGGSQESGMVILEHTGVDKGEGETVLNIPVSSETVVTPPPTPKVKPTPEPKPVNSPPPQIEEEPVEPQVPPAPPTPANFPDKAEAQHAGNVVVFGTRAMEIVYAKPEVMTRYAKAVSDIAAAMPDVQTLLLVTPNSGEFYSAEDMHTGAASQKAIIDTVYSQLSDDVTAIDAYDKLSRHTDEYIYFRTDHHWTALGAYYAYTAMCERLGMEPVALEEFETGEYTDYVGSMYKFTAKYPVSKVLLDNPDTLTYYFPIVETEMTIYPDGPSMNNGKNYPVINTGLGDYGNKYICFIGGDNVLTHIKTSVSNGKSILVIKESFGNAFVPFLTSHYEDIWVVDARKVGGQDQPSFSISGFSAEQDIGQVLYLNYPFMAVSKAYCGYLERIK